MSCNPIDRGGALVDKTDRGGVPVVSPALPRCQAPDDFMCYEDDVVDFLGVRFSFEEMLSCSLQECTYDIVLYKE